MKDKVLALAEELDGVSFKENCDQCLACGTALCRGDMECAESAHKACAKRLREIVEHDVGEVATMSAYDLLPDEDRKAIAWVREQGGLDAVEKRLMPDGMEWLIESWPRFDDNEPARWEDEYENGNGNASPLRHVSLCADGRAMLGKGKTKVVLAPGQRVKRPAPKVLDADGVEIREKCDVWWICEGDERGVHAERLRVETIGLDGLVECSPYNGGTWVYLEPSELYVNEPVLAADGEPLEVGQTVWSTNYGAEYKVCKVDQHSVTVEFWHEGIATHGVIAPYHLTHAKPDLDTWERIEEDARLMPTEYTDRYRVGRFGFEGEDMRVDLVRRCRALAERGE